MGEPKGEGFVRGYSQAEKEFLESPPEVLYPPFLNPFEEGTEEFRGYETAVYDFTQK